MKKLTFLTLAIAVLAFIAPEVFAGTSQEAGAGALKAVTDLLSGNLALVVGIGLAVFGLWSWLVGQNSWGIMMIIAGVILTAFPGIFDGIASASNSFLGDLTGETTFVNARCVDTTGQGCATQN